MKISNPPSSQSQSEGGPYEISFEEHNAAVDKALELPVMDKRAYYGVLGDIAKKVGDNTEADPRGVLPSLLVGIGNVLGHAVYSNVADTSHFCNEYVALVGLTGKARKGLATDITEAVVGFVDDTWKQNCIARNFSTGEGLIALVSDEVIKTKKKKVDGKWIFEPEVVREGVVDKRKLCILPELGELLTVMPREGNSLSSVLRQAWDSRSVLETNTKNSPARATGAHISIIGNITKGELLKLLPFIPNADGFVNRFLWFLVRKLKDIPEGGPKSETYLAKEITQIREAIQFAHGLGEVHRSEAAKEYWDDLYRDMRSEINDSPGALDRAEAHRLRFSNMYAVLDKQSEVGPEHVEAAHALCNYSEACTRQIFGISDLVRDAERVLDFLRMMGDEGATRSLIHNRVFRGHETMANVVSYLRMLDGKFLVRHSSERIGNGNLVERWFAIKPSNNGTAPPKKRTKKA